MPGVNTEQNPSERQMRPKHRAGKMFDFSTPGGIVALLIKVLLLGIIDAVAVVAVYVLISKEQWIALAVFVVLVALVNLIYLARPAPRKISHTGAVLSLDLSGLRNHLHGIHRLHECR